jgi:hypothetical protein
MKRPRFPHHTPGVFIAPVKLTRGAVASAQGDIFLWRRMAHRALPPVGIGFCNSVTGLVAGCEVAGCKLVGIGIGIAIAIGSRHRKLRLDRNIDSDSDLNLRQTLESRSTCRAIRERQGLVQCRIVDVDYAALDGRRPTECRITLAREGLPFPAFLHESRSGHG